MEAKGEDKLFVHALLEHEGYLVKARLNPQTGRLTHYVRRGRAQSALLPQVLIPQEAALQAALGYTGGGTVTDVQFGQNKGHYLYQVKIHMDDLLYRVVLSAEDGSLRGLSTDEPKLMVLAPFTQAAKPPVRISQDDDWLFDKDDDFEHMDDRGFDDIGIDPIARPTASPYVDDDDDD